MFTAEKKNLHLGVKYFSFRFTREKVYFLVFLLINFLSRWPPLERRKESSPEDFSFPLKKYFPGSEEMTLVSSTVARSTGDSSAIYSKKSRYLINQKIPQTSWGQNLGLTLFLIHVLVAAS